MSVMYELLDNYDVTMTIVATENNIYIDFPIGVDQMVLSVDKARQLIEYLKQAIVDVEGRA